MSFHDLDFNISSVLIGQFKYVNMHLAPFPGSFPWVSSPFLLLWVKRLVFVDWCWYTAWTWLLYLTLHLATYSFGKLWTPLLQSKEFHIICRSGKLQFFFFFKSWCFFFLSFISPSSLLVTSAPFPPQLGVTWRHPFPCSVVKAGVLTLLLTPKEKHLVWDHCMQYCFSSAFFMMLVGRWRQSYRSLRVLTLLMVGVDSAACACIRWCHTPFPCWQLITSTEFSVSYQHPSPEVNLPCSICKGCSTFLVVLNFAFNLF